MEKFYLEKPSIERKNEALEYIQEFIDLNSRIHGVGSLNKYLDDYEAWLDMISSNWNIKVTEKLVPSHTYFLIREQDNKIIGMTDIRLSLTEGLKTYGGNIGLSIRPSERQKGYGKLNLYFALKECDLYNIKEVMVDCDQNNIASAQTIKSLGGRLTKEDYNAVSNSIVQDYWINTQESLSNNKELEIYISKKNSME
ncbi:MAG: GNAT family N-acetyltransferase [Bacilli bacterium]|nr:GNAT family N-acetyltransferase [Bacilli bacterium]